MRKTFRLFLVFIILCFVVFTYGNKRHRRACNPTIDLTCGEKGKRRYIYYAYHDEADITPGCAGNKIASTSWSLISKKTGLPIKTSLSPIFNTQARTILPGDYTLKLVAKEKGGGSTTVTCPCRYATEPPSIVFKNAQLQYVLVGMPFTVDITQSKFPNGVPKINWSVRCLYIKEKEEACRKRLKCEDAAPMKGLMFIGLMDECFYDLTYTATVVHEGEEVLASHVVTPRKLFNCRMEIICEKNCDAQGSQLSNPKLNVVLALKPNNPILCLGVNKKNAKWTVKGSEVIPKDKLDMVSENNRLIIQKDSLAYSDYISVVGFVKDEYEAWFRLRTVPNITPPKCTITPASGVSMKTKFTIKCVPTDRHLKLHGPYYTIYQMVDGKKKLVTSSADDSFKVVLSSIKGKPEQQLIVEGRDIFNNEFNCDINPIKVTEIELTKEVIQGTLNTFTDLTKDKNKLGPQFAAALVNEVKQSDEIDKQTSKEVNSQIMNAMINANIDNMVTYDQMSSITQTFVDHKEAMNEKYKESLSKLCKVMSSTLLSLLEKDEYLKYQEYRVKKQAQLNAECADKLLQEIEKDEPETTTVPTFATSTDIVTARTRTHSTTHTTIITTIPSTTLEVVLPVVEEDYPDYVLPSQDPTKETIVTNAMDIITDSALAVAQTLNAGEEYERKTNDTQSYVAVEEGVFMANRPLESGAITVIPTNEFKDAGLNLITAIINNYGRDVLMPQSDLASNIVDVQFYENNKKMKGATYDIEFPIVNDSVPFVRYEVPLPGVDDEFLETDRKMNVHRLNLFGMETCLIRFKIEKNITLRLAMSVNQRPRNKHFQNPRSRFMASGETATTLTIQNPYPKQEKDAFVYLAVIPSKEMLNSRENASELIPYDVQFTEIACVEYNRKKHKWDPSESCTVKVTGNVTNTNVHCLCKRTSLHSVLYKPIPNRLDIQRDIEYMVVDFVNYVIFIHLMIVFLAYAIALGLILRRQTKIYGRDRIYFLSDNLKNDKFAYMLVVRTGTYNSSGTTANIMAQVTGSKDKSLPHVLNYPDPACKLLQRDGDDWFIMAHSRHLGELESIVLWTDGIGLYPAWFCEDITIYDLQTFKPYTFKVETWISPLEKHAPYVRIPVTPPGKKVKEKINLVKHIRFHYSGRHTWNIFMKDDEFITYPERLTVILSMIYTTYMVVVWLLGPPTLTHADSFGHGEFQIYSILFTYPIASSLICSVIHFPMIYFLRNSKRTEVTVAFVVSVNRYPFKVRKIIWYILMIWIVLCMVYLITFAFWVTLTTVYLWMFITFLSLVLSIVLWENLYIILFDIISHQVGNFDDVTYRFDMIIIEIERQRKILYNKFGEVMLRPYFKKHYKLLTPNEIFDLRHYISIRLEVASIFKDMCLFLVYVFILYLIVLTQYDISFNVSNRMMHRMVDESIYSDGLYLLKDIKHVEDVYNYIEHVIIPLTHPTSWYGKWYATDAGVMADYSTRILGVVQLRQQRRKQVCAVPKTLEKLAAPCTNKAPIFDDWEYNDGSHITSTIGHFRIYDGSGYIANIGRTLKNAYFILDLLRKYKWIDINTEVLFIDFLAYNSNINLFNAVRITIERSPTGYFYTSSEVYTTSLLSTDIWSEIFLAFIYVLLITIIIIMILKRIIQLMILKAGYFNDFWNILDLILMLLSIVLVTLYFLRRSYTATLLKTLVETEHNLFVNYYHLVSISDALILTYGITLSLATLRLWKFLHFGVLFRIMERTILKAGPQLAGLFLYQICIYFMMVMFIYPMYGENLVEFRDYYRSLVTLYLASINFTEHLAVYSMYTSMETSYLYLVYSFYLIVSLCFDNLYATTLIINLEEARIYYSNTKLIYTIHHYVMDVFNFNREKIRRHIVATRLRGGTDQHNIAFNVEVDKLIKPKSDIHRYANMVQMNSHKMNLMRNVALVAIKKVLQYGKERKIADTELDKMAWIIANLFKMNDETWNAKMHVFYKISDPITEKVKFVPESRVRLMEMMTRRILGQAEDEVVELETEHSKEHMRWDEIERTLDLYRITVNNIVVVEDKERIIEAQQNNFKGGFRVVRRERKRDDNEIDIDAIPMEKKEGMVDIPKGQKKKGNSKKLQVESVADSGKSDIMAKADFENQGETIAEKKEGSSKQSRLEASESKDLGKCVYIKKRPKRKTRDEEKMLKRQKADKSVDKAEDKSVGANILPVQSSKSVGTSHLPTITSSGNQTTNDRMNQMNPLTKSKHDMKIKKKEDLKEGPIDSNKFDSTGIPIERKPETMDITKDTLNTKEAQGRNLGEPAKRTERTNKSVQIMDPHKENMYQKAMHSKGAVKVKDIIKKKHDDHSHKDDLRDKEKEKKHHTNADAIKKRIRHPRKKKDDQAGPDSPEPAKQELQSGPDQADKIQETTGKLEAARKPKKSALHKELDKANYLLKKDKKDSELTHKSEIKEKKHLPNMNELKDKLTRPIKRKNEGNALEPSAKMQDEVIDKSEEPPAKPEEVGHQTMNGAAALSSNLETSPNKDVGSGPKTGLVHKVIHPKGTLRKLKDDKSKEDQTRKVKKKQEGIPKPKESTLHKNLDKAKHLLKKDKDHAHKPEKQEKEKKHLPNMNQVKEKLTKSMKRKNENETVDKNSGMPSKKKEVDVFDKSVEPSVKPKVDETVGKPDEPSVQQETGPQTMDEAAALPPNVETSSNKDAGSAPKTGLLHKATHPKETLKKSKGDQSSKDKKEHEGIPAERKYGMTNIKEKLGAQINKLQKRDKSGDRVSKASNKSPNTSQRKDLSRNAS